ncbi:uncharacterized protein TNIN_327621 [Trichonephila inaurata madagascariensis]|uniref:Uncharacterized protein n=1 Tax=Trichonephila inaurata madagascariensis TaxID=2747483 RepID=A0A8X6XPM9_9ARAC|nr:uncharacterized protein TNIN_327621 [Trichonephila inaurata madagascariensis]
MRYISQGLPSLETLCSLMCLPNPVYQKAYDKINAKIADVSEALGNASMKKAAAEETIIHDTLNSVLISGDGNWKTCGHTSLIGVCTLIGARLRVLDMIISSYCKGCDSYKGPKFGPKYSAFWLNTQTLAQKNLLPGSSWRNGSLRNTEFFFFRSEQKQCFGSQQYSE